jgi:mono/diheme cytochrome c family protein
MLRPACALALGLAIAVPAAAAPQVAAIVERGAEVAQGRCASCHAVAMEARSPNSEAPLFRVLSRLYSARDLETKLVAISEHGHFEMPALALREDEIEDVAAYIASLDGGERRDKPPDRPHGTRDVPTQLITSAAKRSISSY